MSKPDINLEKVDAIVEARIGYHLYSEKVGQSKHGDDQVGGAVVQAGVVLLSASFQAFVEDVFFETSMKCFGRELNEQERSHYYKTWKFWGNPNPHNIRRLFQRLAIDDVFAEFSAVKLSAVDFKETLDDMNKIRNRIAHGQALELNEAVFRLNLSVLRDWSNKIKTGSKALRIAALYQSGV